MISLGFNVTRADVHTEFEKRRLRKGRIKSLLAYTYLCYLKIKES